MRNRHLLISGQTTLPSETGADVARVGVAGAMVGVQPVDDRGRPVRPAVLLVAGARGQSLWEPRRRDAAAG